jgi:hypothetical protein
MTNSNSVTKGFWIVSIIGILWNLMGTFQFFLEFNYWRNPESRASLPQDLTPFYDSTPAWLYVVFAIAVATGLLGCIGLIARKAWAVPVFLVSLISVIVQMGYNLIGTELISVIGPGAAVMPIVVVLIALGLYLYSKNAASKGWLA